MAQPLTLVSDSGRPQDLVSEVKKHLSQHLRGKTQVVELSMATFLAGGHLLLEGPPGTGKTSLAKAMSTAFGGTFRRIQMTSDMLPSDIVGILRLRRKEQQDGNDFEFRKGPIFSNFLLADELNRTSPKTQSALLEAMAEHTVTVDGKSYELPNPFFVVATQNPAEFQGVYPLAESQLDRFMLQLILSTPEKDDELTIYRAKPADPASELRSVLTLEQTLEMRKLAASVFIDDSVLDYATNLVRGTRSRSEILHGVSVRGGLQLIAAARALALVRGREFVTPADVADLAIPALAHRISFINGEPDVSRRQEIIREILESVPAPK